MLRYLFTLLSLTAARASPASVANATTPHEYVGWRGEPAGRGTWSILSTCLITLTLCVWTVVHLNLPGKKGGGAFGTVGTLFYKPRWVLMGILVPEVVVYIAWSQWLSAKSLQREIEAERNRVSHDLRHKSVFRLTPWHSPRRASVINGR